MDNMIHYDRLRVVPADALKPIEFGKLKGKSDINPQYRYEAMTREFGVCGIGWKYEIVKTWTQDLQDGQTMLFVQINLHIKDGEKWSDAIPAIGGDFVIEKDKNGIHGNDEAYKMATTDALGVAMKMLGVAADVYRGLANDSKYGRQQAEKPVSDSITDAQLSKLVMLAKEYGISNQDMKDLIKWKFKANSSKELTIKQAGLLISNMIGMWEEYAAKVQSAATKENE